MDTNNVCDPHLIQLSKYLTLCSTILTIKDNIKTESFTFNEVSLFYIEREINNLKSQKPGTFGNIPTTILKETPELCSKTLQNIWNTEIIASKTFPENKKTCRHHSYLHKR